MPCLMADTLEFESTATGLVAPEIMVVPAR
jgi:hypothetical protein